VNKKAQLGTSVTFLVIILIVILLWIYIVNPQLSANIPAMITTNNITGLQAVLWNNLNLFFFVTMFLMVLGYFAIMRAQSSKRYLR
jgi:preprotein translocase subunit YajC